MAQDWRLRAQKDSNRIVLILSEILLGDQRLSGHKKNDPSNFKELTKKEVDVVLGYIQLWPQRFVVFHHHRPSSLNFLFSVPGSACVVIVI